jgi:hypothetical protein
MDREWGTAPGTDDVVASDSRCGNAGFGPFQARQDGLSPRHDQARGRKRLIIR